MHLEWKAEVAVSKYLGPVFSLVMCLAALVTCVVTLFFTKLPLILPITLGAMAVITGLMVKRDWSVVWKPLLFPQPPAPPAPPAS